MRIEATEEGKNIIRRVCPYHDERVIRCIHCDPPEAPCARSDGIFECVKGVLCAEGGNPDDVVLCPYNALFWRDGLYKCDMCVERGYPICKERGGDEITVILEEKDMEEVGNEIGWVLTDNGIVSEMPILPWEARVARKVIDIYQRTKGEYSIEEILDDLSEELSIPERTKERVEWIVDITLSPLGPLNLIKGDNIEEIVVVGLKRPVMVYERGKGWRETNIYIWTEEYFLNLVNRAGEKMGRLISIKEPRMHAILEDGSRIHAVIPPISNVHSITVRRFRESPLTISSLIESGSISYGQAATLWAAIERELNILIAGNTGSGKTTLLNALMGFVPLDERVIAVEEVPEINIPHPHFVRMVVSGVSMKDLIRDTLRMRPDRVIVGEIRKDEEAEAYMDTVLAGQGRGSYTTMHGRSVKEVLSRLVSMGVRKEDLDSIDVVVVVRRWGEGGRIVRRVVELVSNESLDDVEERVTFLKNNPVYDLETFARRYTCWRCGE